jgi:hypothetical protein
MKIQYQCEVCKALHDTLFAAIICESKNETPIVQVGDIVIARAGFSWFDGDIKWVHNPEVKKNPAHGNCFKLCCSMAFYYVVTDITPYHNNPHQLAYHLRTGAMLPANGYSNGYTTETGHFKPVLMPNPPQEIVEDSKRFIGMKSESLL